MNQTVSGTFSSREFYNTAEAAKFLADLGVPFSRGTLSVWRCQKVGPEYRLIRNRPFYSRESLLRFVKGRRVVTVDSMQELES